MDSIIAALTGASNKIQSGGPAGHALRAGASPTNPHESSRRADSRAAGAVRAGGWYDAVMRRVGRWLVRIGVAVSLILAVGVGVLWGRSYDERDRTWLDRADEEGQRLRHRILYLASSEGRLRVSSVNSVFS